MYLVESGTEHGALLPLGAAAGGARNNVEVYESSARSAGGGKRRDGWGCVRLTVDASGEWWQGLRWPGGVRWDCSIRQRVMWRDLEAYWSIYVSGFM